jgi:hypothetical protein
MVVLATEMTTRTQQITFNMAQRRVKSAEREARELQEILAEFLKNCDLTNPE